MTPSSHFSATAEHVSPTITPEQVRRMEENRLKAKALAAHRDVALRRENSSTASRQPSSSYLVAGQKRTRSATTEVHISTSRDARSSPAITVPNSNNGLASAQDGGIRAARKFQKFVEYDFSKMTDTKGGFMTEEEACSSKGSRAREEGSGKPAHMTLPEWEQVQLRRRMRDRKGRLYEPGLSILEQTPKKCRECGSLEIDWLWDEVLHCQVCNSCKDRFPDQYSLLTKTEAKEDYLLTDPELKDEQLLPHMEKPNPHKSTFHNMMLYLRYQVEEYAFSEQKWGSAEALDEEFEKRTRESKDRKEKKFRTKLKELKKRTRVDAYKHAQGGGGGEFGDTIGHGRHEHEWGRPGKDPETGTTKRVCLECGMEVEELEL